MALTIDPANEVMLNEATIARFRTGYAAAFPGTSLSDPLYEAVSAGRRYPGMEHWLPLFYDSLETLFDYLPDAPLSFDQLSEEALASRRAEIEEYYNARIEAKTRENFGAPPYNPLPPERLYLGREALFDSLQSRPVFQLTAFEVPQTATTPVMSVAGRQGRSFRRRAGGSGAQRLSGGEASHRGAAQGRQAGADRRLDGGVARPARDHPARS